MISSLLSTNSNRHHYSLHTLPLLTCQCTLSTIPRVARMALTPHKNYVHKIFPISLVRKFHHNRSLLRVFSRRQVDVMDSKCHFGRHYFSGVYAEPKNHHSPVALDMDYKCFPVFVVAFIN